MNSSSVTGKVYEYITKKSDISCDEVPAIACREAPGSFFLNAANGTLTKLAEAVASPGLVLPWLLASAGAPATGPVFMYPVSLVKVSLYFRSRMIRETGHTGTFASFTGNQQLCLFFSNMGI